MQIEEGISEQQLGSNNDNVDETLHSHGEEILEKPPKVAMEETTTSRRK